MTRDTTHQLLTGIVVLLAAMLGVLICSLADAATWPRTLVRWPTTIKSAAQPAAKPGMMPAGGAAQDAPRPPKSIPSGAIAPVPPGDAGAGVTAPPAAPGGTCRDGKCGIQTKHRFFNLWRK